jgi:hypothetical protein
VKAHDFSFEPEPLRTELATVDANRSEYIDSLLRERNRAPFTWRDVFRGKSGGKQVTLDRPQSN